MPHPIKQKLYNLTVSNPELFTIVRFKEPSTVEDKWDDRHEEVVGAVYIPNGATKYKLEEWKFSFVRVEEEWTDGTVEEKVIHPIQGQKTDVSEYSLVVSNGEELFYIDQKYSLTYYDEVDYEDHEEVENRFCKAVEVAILTQELKANIKPSSVAKASRIKI